MSARLTFDSYPLRPESLAARMERRRIIGSVRWQYAREWVDSGRKELTRFRQRERYRRQRRRAQAAKQTDRARWKALRKDVARGVPKTEVMSLYGVSEREYWTALAAGSREA